MTEAHSPRRRAYHVAREGRPWRRRPRGRPRASVRLHVEHLGAPGIEHTITIEPPPADAMPGEQLPLI